MADRAQRQRQRQLVLQPTTLQPVVQPLQPLRGAGVADGAPHEGGAASLPVARHAKRGLVWVKSAQHSCQGLFWAGVATDQAGFGQSS